MYKLQKSWQRRKRNRDRGDLVRIKFKQSRINNFCRINESLHRTKPVSKLWINITLIFPYVYIGQTEIIIMNHGFCFTQIENIWQKVVILNKGMKRSDD